MSGLIDATPSGACHF